ncbi:hypothetical protein L9F63_015065, partial [Diploptera punctata]
IWCNILYELQIPLLQIQQYWASILGSICLDTSFPYLKSPELAHLEHYFPVILLEREVMLFLLCYFQRE